MTTSDLLKLDDKRMAELKSPYDPIFGVGSLVPRFEIQMKQKSKKLYLPVSMKEQVGALLDFPTVEDYCKDNFSNWRKNYDEILIYINDVRTKEDFEFWCATCVMITPKTPDGHEGAVIPFVLNKPQRRLAALYETNRINQTPNRVVILKARQWGGSTVTDINDIFTVVHHVKNWNIAIVAHVEEASRNVRGMMTTLAKYHPKEVFDVKLVPYEGSSKTKAILDSDGLQFRSVVSIGSMEKPEGLNSKDIKRFHASESGLWKKTIGKDPFNLAANIEASIPFIPHSSIVYESTAQGSGNFFHKKFTDAQKGLSGFTAFFVPWFEIERYTKPFENESERVKLLETLSGKDLEMWEAGATLEGINWHRFTRRDYDEIYMGQHFPTTPEEAFQTTGRRVFAPKYVKSNRKYCCPPKFVGEIFAEGKKDNIHFEEVVGGNFFVWFKPETEPKVANRYIVQVDIGATSEKASYSTIRVIDRFDLINGGVEEAIATWKGHLDVDLVIWKAVQIAIWYNNALLSFESNPIDSEEARESEGDHTISLLDEIAGVYSNLFTRTDPEKVRQGHPVKYGIHTNTKSKTDYVNQYRKRLRERGYIEYDDRVNDEADTYEYKENGRVKAKDGCHDDLLENTMMGLKVSDLMPLPYIVKPETSRAAKRVINEASF